MLTRICFDKVKWVNIGYVTIHILVCAFEYVARAKRNESARVPKHVSALYCAPTRASDFLLSGNPCGRFLLTANHLISNKEVTLVSDRLD